MPGSSCCSTGGGREVRLFLKMWLLNLEAGNEDDDSNDDADDNGSGGRDDDVVQPLALAHPLRPDLAALREGHVRRRYLHLKSIFLNFLTSPKAYHCNSWLNVLQRNLHWNLLEADDTNNDALIVRHILDLELALAWRQGRSLLELWRPKQSGWENFNFDAVRKSKQTCRWRENQGCLLFLIPTWSLSSFSPLHFNILFCTNNNDNKK